MAKMLTRTQLIALLRKKGAKVTKATSNADLVRCANKLGLGARKASGSSHKRYRKAKKIRPRETAFLREGDRIEAVIRKHIAGSLTQSQAMRKLGLSERSEFDRRTFEKLEKRVACRRNPGPDPYRKDMLILDPGGISYTGPFGPFGQYDPQRRRNPGLPAPGQVVGMGDYMQMNPAVSTPYGVGDYLLEREVVQDGLSGLNDYMLLDMTPPAPRKKNPSRRRSR